MKGDLHTLYFWPRSAEARLRHLLRSFPLVLVYGPRQSGKSTLLRMALPRWRILDLERASDYALLTADTEAFLDAVFGAACATSG